MCTQTNRYILQLALSGGYFLKSHTCTHACTKLNSLGLMLYTCSSEMMCMVWMGHFWDRLMIVYSLELMGANLLTLHSQNPLPELSIYGNN